VGTAKLTRVLASEEAGFQLKFKNEVNPFRVSAVFVMPGETIQFEIDEPRTNHIYTLESQAGLFVAESGTKWQWTAPARPGLTVVRVSDVVLKDDMTLNVFVMVPASRVKRGVLNGYRIGQYPLRPLKGNPIYEVPRGFVEVTSQNRDVAVSPHFTLGQFLCKQKGGYPKYLVLKERLVYQLENILGQVNERGYRTDTLAVMSGYRTPYYNHAIRNVPFSRHQYGDAADIFIDRNRDGDMDDLNGDGKVNFKDSQILSDIIGDLDEEDSLDRFAGGVGTYRATRAHGPFVHVDTRGNRAQWAMK